MDDSMKEIVNDFVQEAIELLEDLSENFIELEKDPENKDLLNTIFRAAHTVKGSAGFLGFQNIVELAHSAENILNRLRQGEIILTPDMMDYLLRSMDVLKTMIVTVSETGSEGEVPEGNGELIEKLNELAEEKQEDAELAPPDEKKDEQPLPPPSIEELPERDISNIQKTDEKQSSKKKARNLGDILLEDNLISKEELEQIYKEKEAEEVSSDVSGEEHTEPVAEEKAPAASEKPVQEKAAPPKPPKKAAMPSPVQAVSQELKETTIRVDIERLDSVMNLVGELVLARNRLFNISSKMEQRFADEEISATLSQVVSNLNLVTTDLQLAVMKTRMQQVKKVFSKFPRMVRDLSRELGKSIELQIFGEETELDKSVIEEIGDPLVHLIRNSVDHGIEDGETRKQMGKPETGTIKLLAEHEGNYIIINVSDDGKGIDPATLRKKAVQKGLMDEKTASGLSDKDALNLIFMPGFSTKDKTTEISGRGVGMDVVKTNIQKLNGIIDIESVIGEGSSIVLKLPLTVAIIQTLIVGVKDEIFAIPLNSVVETLRIPESSVQTIDRHEVINLRKSVLSLLRLGDEFDIRDSGKEDAGKDEDATESNTAATGEKEIYVVVVALAEKRIGIVVDKLYGQEEVVIKSLGDYQLGYKGISGATITGDGRVVLIIDIASLIEFVKKR